MAKAKKQEEVKQPTTRAEKRDAAKNVIREILEKNVMKNKELIEEGAKFYAERFGGEDTENPNDVKGFIGSLLDVMKKDGEIIVEDGVCALKTVEKKLTTPKAKKEKNVKEKKEETPKEEKPVKAKRTAKKTKTEEPLTEESKETNPMPAPPVPPVAPPTTDPVVAPKKRGRKAKEKAEDTPVKELPVAAAEEKPAEVNAPVEEKPTEVKAPVEEKVAQPVAEEVKEEKKEIIVRPETQVSPKGTVMDMSFLFGQVKPKKEEPKKEELKKEEPKKDEPQKQPPQKPVEEKPVKEEKPAPIKEQKPQAKKAEVVKAEGNKNTVTVAKKPATNVRTQKRMTVDEKLQETFLNKLRRLGGEYFEYYSVYLLERYSRRNGRRLEGLKISAGDKDGGIDGEIELTDRLGFRETIYIQAKNWDPDKGDERLWTVGETLLQQFIGACVCRQAKDGKQHCRGIFMTTSRFTPDAKRILEQTSDKFVGYDGADIFEAAKECEFGLVRKNGEWVLDENLLSGVKAFYTMI